MAGLKELLSRSGKSSCQSLSVLCITDRGELELEYGGYNLLKPVVMTVLVAGCRKKSFFASLRTANDFFT